MKRDRPRHPVMLGGQLDPSGSKPSQVLQETETGREEVLPAPQPDVIPEVEPQSIEEPPGPTPRPRPFLRGSRMLPDERVVPCVQAREEEELREVRVVDPRSLNELELTPDVALERLEQEADFRRETCGEVFHARIEVYDVLLEFSEDQVAPEGIVFGREQIIDQD